MQKKRISVPHFLSVINLIGAVSNHVDGRMILNLLVKSTAPAYMYIKDIHIKNWQSMQAMSSSRVMHPDQWKLMQFSFTVMGINGGEKNKHLNCDMFL